MPTKPVSFAGFTKATVDDYTKHRIIGLSVGEPGSRKTSFWLEAPGPIAVFSMDQGLEGVVDRELRNNPKKEIHVKEYEWFPTRDEDMQDAAIELRDSFIADFEAVLPHARTILWDKENDFWALFRYAEFGPEGNDAPRNYPALNQRYRRLVNLAKASDVNIGFIDGMKDEWGAKTKSNGAQGVASTGNRIRNGFGELPGLVHTVLTHTGVGENDWSIEVGKVRGPGMMTLAGNNIGNVTFTEFASMLFPESDESEWL
jgi:hypothetical protein